MQFVVKTPWTDDRGHHAIGDRIDMDEAVAGLGLERGLIARPDALAEVREAANRKALDMIAEDAARGAVEKARGKKKTSWRKYGADVVAGVLRRDDKYLDVNFGCKRHEWAANEVISAKAAMAEASGATGGYAVPAAMARTILAPYFQRSIFRANGALQLATRARSVFIPQPDLTGVAAAGTPPWAGSFGFVWTAEGKTRTEGEPKFNQTELVKNELSGSILISRPLLDDGAQAALQEAVAAMIGQAVLWLEDYAFFQGTGSGMPAGVINAVGATLAVNRQTANSVTYQDVSTMLSKLTPGSIDSAVWAFSPTAQTKLLQLVDGSNRAAFFSTGNSRPGERPQWSLAGLPAFPTDAVPALGTRGDLCLIDPRYYAIHDHGDAPGGSVEIISSDHVNFLSNQVTLRVVRRTDGGPLLGKAVTLGDGSSQASPFVVLN